MAEGHFEGFREALAPFLNLFSSGRVACIAARTKSGDFVCLATRISLREQPLVGEHVIEDIQPTPGFYALVVDHTRADTTQLIRQVVVNGLLELQVGQHVFRTYLTRDRAKGAEFAFTWLPARLYPRVSAQHHFGVDRPCLVLEGYYEQTRELLADSLEEVNSKLRLREPPINGLDELFPRITPGIGFDLSSTAPAQIVVELPFDFGYVIPGLRLSAPKPAFDEGIQISVFFGSRTTASLRPNVNDTKEIDRSGMRQWEQPLDWPDGVETATAFLFYRGEKIDELSFGRRPWPNICLTVDDYFDPDHTQLREFLAGTSSKKGDNFEWAVVRLFNLLGIPLVWYGKGAAERRPDAAAAIIQPGQTPLVLLGDCTQEKPHEKFSGLAERARELREHLGGDVQVLPVVFAACGIVGSEIDQAAERGIALLGRADLESFLERLATVASSEEVIALLRTRSSPPLG